MDIDKHFTLEVSHGEMRDLSWIADRYSSAQIVLESLEDTDRPFVYIIKQIDVIRAIKATLEDGGNYGVVPCLGGDLGFSIHHIFTQVLMNNQ